MKRAWLHEIAKFGAGLVVADFLTGWWFITQTQIEQMTFWGFTVTKDTASMWMLVDVFLFIFLVHYAWHVGKLPRIKERMYFLFAGSIFAVVCAGHFVRALTGADLTLFGWYVPEFISWIGVVVTFYLAYASFHLAGRRK